MGGEPHHFLQVFILRNFKSNDFVTAYSKGFAEAFFVSAHSKGFASARVRQAVTIFAFKATSEVNTMSTGNSSLPGMGCGKCVFERDARYRLEDEQKG